MSPILRGSLDDALEYFNFGNDGESFFNEEIPDPMPAMIEVWEKYNRWCIGISRGGGGERVSETALCELDKDAITLFEGIQEVFPFKHGAKDEDKAWNILKGHNVLRHMTDSVRMYGRIEVKHAHDQQMMFTCTSFFDKHVSFGDTLAHAADSNGSVTGTEPDTAGPVAN